MKLLIGSNKFTLYERILFDWLENWKIKIAFEFECIFKLLAYAFSILFF